MNSFVREDDAIRILSITIITDCQDTLGKDL